MPEISPSLLNYLTPEKRQLISDGIWLLQDREAHPSAQLSDHSYLVFPFAKLYEGFLKQIFWNLGIITERDYKGDHFRIGKALSPNLERRLGHRSAFGLLTKRYGPELPAKLWFAWKQGRNLIFHYFPHNYRALNFIQAKETINLLLTTMEEAVTQTGITIKNSPLRGA